MAEYLNKQTALDAILAEYPDAHYPEWYAAKIKALPAADVAPVVRCKDCIHYDLGVCLKIYSDGNAQKDSWQSRNPNDFCSYGERKDGGADNV